MCRFHVNMRTIYLLVLFALCYRAQSSLRPIITIFDIYSYTFNFILFLLELVRLTNDDSMYAFESVKLTVFLKLCFYLRRTQHDNYA